MPVIKQISDQRTGQCRRHTGNLDPVRSLDLMLLLEKINELGTTVLVVTHEKELVNAFSKRVIAIDEGVVVSDGMEGYYSNENQ